LWVFGFRYRRLLQRWIDHQQRKGTAAATPGGQRDDKRVNWAGVAIGQYYGALRRALVVAIVIRALAVFGSAGAVGWWILRKWRRNRRQGAGGGGAIGFGVGPVSAV
jgi:hypothetical protein